MDDIRRLEHETKLILQRKLGRPVEEEEEEEGEDGNDRKEEGGKEEAVLSPSSNQTHPDPASIHTSTSSTSPSSPPSLPLSTTHPLSKAASESHTGRRTLPDHTHYSRPAMRRMRSLPGGVRGRERAGGERGREVTGGERGRGLAVSSSIRSMHWLRSEVGHGRTHSRPPSMAEQVSDTESMYSARPEWALDSIAIVTDSESELEFFDARGKREREGRRRGEGGGEGREEERGGRWGEGEVGRRGDGERGSGKGRRRPTERKVMMEARLVWSKFVLFFYSSILLWFTCSLHVTYFSFQ